MQQCLSRLGVPKDVQLFFKPFFTTSDKGDLLFSYGDNAEHFNSAFHVVPDAVHWWYAGNTKLQLIRQVLICASAMEAIAFLSLNQHRFPRMDSLFFISCGVCPRIDQLAHIKILFKRYTAGLVFGRDILGRITDIKVASALCGRTAQIEYLGNELFSVNEYTLTEKQLSLSALEKASAMRSGIRTYKPKHFNSYLEQLKHSSYGSR